MAESSSQESQSCLTEVHHPIPIMHPLLVHTRNVGFHASCAICVAWDIFRASAAFMSVDIAFSLGCVRTLEFSVFGAKAVLIA